MIQLTFSRALVLLRQVHQRSVLFATTVLLKITDLGFNRLSAMDVMMY